MDKEFDIGAGLNHPALPRYLEFHRDYIVMDYVDGSTLADMIKRKDPWLSNNKNVLRLIQELVDVVDYLHRHNVVHCDIKPDNIMIRSNNKNLVLVDFDKSYTDALNDTSGHPGKYGLEINDVGKTAVDFRGIGMVVEQLRAAGFKFKKSKAFVKGCYSPDIDCEKLRDYLTDSGSRSDKAIIFSIISLIAIGLSVFTTIYFMTERNRPTSEPNPETIEDTTVESLADSAVQPDLNSVHTRPDADSNEPHALSQEDIHNDA